MMRRRSVAMRLPFRLAGVFNMTGPAVLMVHEPTVGMHHDAVCLAKALRKIEPGIRVHSLDIPWNPNLDYECPLQLPKEVSSAAPFDAVFLFEHLYGNPPLRAPAFARRRIFIPNLEWILPQDEIEILIRKPDAILYKNRFSRDMCERIPGFNDVPVRELTGWTSWDFRQAGKVSAKKDFHSFLHVKGLSDQKQTSLVLGAWLENPDFPRLTIIATMHDSFHIPVPLRAAHNVEIVFRKIPPDELRGYQEAHGVHIYPSVLEGFGHSLNEARICESVLVTTDGPPMNDLVAHGQTGFLIPVQHTAAVRRSISYEIEQAALTRTVRSTLGMSEEQLSRVGAQARKAYLADNHSFNTRIAEIFGATGPLCLSRAIHGIPAHHE
jgi:glycosyltransferase involved in cell wall biosynthesis